MRLALGLLLLLTPALGATQAQDRAAIDKTIVALNHPAQRAALYARNPESTLDFDRLIAYHQRSRPQGAFTVGMNEPWTALTVPHVVSGAIHFIGKDVALVDGASVIDGAVTLAPRVPLFFVMKRENGRWRISSVRVGAAPFPVP